MKRNEDEDKHLFDIHKKAYSKDDVSGLNRLLKRSGKNRVTGEERKSFSGGFRVSGKCRPEVAHGHNVRDPAWVEKRIHIDNEGYRKTYLDGGSLEECYKEIFDEYVEEYNRKQTRKDRRINNYLDKILQDSRRGSMKTKYDTDNSRKPMYEFIFQIGKRDQPLDKEESIKILEKFCLEWMPEHYPNLKATGIYLHADEYTTDPVSCKRKEGSVHVHFDFIPVAHALTEEEQKEEKEWKKKLEEQAIKEAEEKGEKFNKTKFENQDWQMLRVQKFGKALKNGMLLQSSLTGACAEMGFRTKGKLTAQIQMEEAVRQDLMDLAESYGVQINREVEKNRDKTVSIDEYKSREDNKRVLAENQRLMNENEKKKKQNAQKECDLRIRENKVKNLEKEKEEVSLQRAELNNQANQIAPYVKRIVTLVEDENKFLEKHRRVVEREEKVSRTETAVRVRNRELEEKESKLKDRESELEVKKEKLEEREQTVSDQEKALKNEKLLIETDREINQKNAEKNEKNLKEINQKLRDFYEKESEYRLFDSTLRNADEIKINVDDMTSKMKDEFYNFSASRNEIIENVTDRFKQTCLGILKKFKDEIRGFQDYLKGKTSKDFRDLADDMDRNGVGTFEEYDEKKASGDLDWQKRSREEKVSLESVKKKNQRDWDVER